MAVPSLNYIKNDTVFIYGDFDSTIATDVIPDLLKLVEDKSRVKNSVIKFYIDSPGGEVHCLFNLLAIVESAKISGITIETYVFGRAYSCGSMLAVAGTKGRRFISRYAEHLCHLGVTNIYASNDTELDRQAIRLKNYFNTVRSLYKRYASIKNLDNVIKDDKLYIVGEDIIANGLADKIID